MNPGQDSSGRAPAAGVWLAAMLLAPDVEARPPERAVSVDAAYAGELWQNAAGGIETGSVYLDQIEISAEIDAENAWGWSGTRFRLQGLYNNGNTLSASKTGDLQTVSNIESAANGLRVYEAWAERPIGAHGSVKLGLYDLNSEFDVLDSSSLFVHSAHGIGTDIGQTGRNGPSIFPITSLALRLAWEWSNGWSARVAALDAVPGDDDDPTEAGIDLSSEEGALLISELERSSPRSTLLFGLWGYTAEFERWQEPGETGAPPRSAGNKGAYVRGEWRPTRRVSLFGRWGLASDEFNTFEAFVGAGMRWQGPIPARPDDVAGVAVAWAEASSAYRTAQDHIGTDVESREVALEVTYRLPLGERLVLQPDLQYVRNPGLDPTVDAALAIGLRVELMLF